MPKLPPLLTILAIFLSLATTPATANQIDLSTVPARDTVQLTIYNSEDLTLVRETRRVVFKEGNNPLQFSWANTLIDPTSVRLRFLTHADQLDVLDTTYPHDRPQELTWNVGSEHAGAATLEISYFTSGISWQAAYDVFVAPDEQTARIEGHVAVSNHSGEAYPDAQVRLVVGTINLVERVADLARQAGRSLDDFDERGLRDLAQKAQRGALRRAERALVKAAQASPEADSAKEIVKQGLSEYFIFTIDGTETLPNNSRKRLPSFRADEAPLNVQYRYRPQQYGDHLARFLLMKNDEPSGMGVSPLPNGAVSVFRRNDRGGLSWLASQSVPYIPIGEDLELNLGQDPDVGFEKITRRVFRRNLWLKLHGVKTEHRADAPGVRFHPRSRVSGWDEHTVFTRRVRNDTPRPIQIEVRDPIRGDAAFISRLGAKRHDNHTVQYAGTLGPGERFDADYETIVRHGRNAKQQRVEIVDGDPATPTVARR